MGRRFNRNVAPPRVSPPQLWRKCDYAQGNVMRGRAGTGAGAES